MRSQLLAARMALAALILAVLTAVAAVAGVRLDRLSYGAGITLMWPATVLGAAALVLALVWLVSAVNRNRGEGKRLGLAALIGALAFLYPPLHSVMHGLGVPPVTDVASDPDDPPHFVALAKSRRPGMNSPLPDPGEQVRYKGETNTISYMLHTYYGISSPIPITKPHAYLLKGKVQMFWHAFETVKQVGWRIVDYSPDEGRIEAVATSFWFGQASDIAVRVTKAGAIGARVDIRSQSESGPDFGRNIDNLKRFFDAFRGGGY